MKWQRGETVWEWGEREPGKLYWIGRGCCKWGLLPNASGR
jgi:hypothetical protein